jgi:hypothetical protein
MIQIVMAGTNFPPGIHDSDQRAAQIIRRVPHSFVHSPAMCSGRTMVILFCFPFFFVDHLLSFQVDDLPDIIAWKEELIQFKIPLAFFGPPGF